MANTRGVRFWLSHGVSVLVFVAVYRGPKPAVAEIFTSAIEVTGTVNFVTDPMDDTLGAIQFTSATQSGEIGLRSGGVVATSVMNGRPITGPASRSGPLTHIGDGLSAEFDVSTGSTNQADGLGGIFGEFELVVANQSSIESYFVTLQVDYTQHSGTSGTGTDAYVDNWFYLYEGTSFPGIGLIESEPNADTLFNPPGSGPFDVSRTEFVVIRVEPGETKTLSGAQEIFTESFKQGGVQASSDATAVSEISISQVVITPEPATVSILALGMFLLGSGRKRALCVAKAMASTDGS